MNPRIHCSDVFKKIPPLIRFTNPQKQNDEQKRQNSIQKNPQRYQHTEIHTSRGFEERDPHGTRYLMGWKSHDYPRTRVALLIRSETK